MFDDSICHLKVSKHINFYGLWNCNIFLYQTPSRSLYFKVAAPVRACKRAVYFNTCQTSWSARVPDPSCMTRLVLSTKSCETIDQFSLNCIRRFINIPLKREEEEEEEEHFRFVKFRACEPFFPLNVYERHVTFRLEFPGHRYVGWTLQGHRG